MNTAPVITSAASVSLAENITQALDVNSTDSGDDPSSEGSGLTYSIAGGADSSLFTIDSVTGVLNFASAPDFEAPADAGTDNVYNVDVTVTDAGGLTDTQSIAITVTDVNTAPVITSAASVSLAENITQALDVNSTDSGDDPSSEGSGLTYSIAGGADSSLFTIDSVTGVLNFASAPDFEAPADAGTDNVYNVDVTVTDAGGLTDTQSIAITVTDVNTAPTITTGAFTFLPENTTVALDVNSTDSGVNPNSEGAGLTYSISGGADSGLFTIDTSTGILSFLSAPDFENPTDAGANNGYKVTVTVTDAGGLSDTESFFIVVTNVAEPPVITSNGAGNTAAITLAENITGVTDVQSSDSDGDSETAGLTYSISGGADSSLFTIDTVTGVLNFMSAPNFEAPSDAGTDNV